MRNTAFRPVSCRVEISPQDRLNGSAKNPRLLCFPRGRFHGRGPKFTTRSLALLGLVVAGLGSSGCNQDHETADAKKSPAPKSAEPLKAVVATATLESWPTVVRCQGSLVADDQTVLGSRVAGLVRDTLVDVGDQVEPGQTMVALDDSEFKLQLAAAEAALMQARALLGLKPGEPVTKLDPTKAPPVREARAVFEEAQSRRERWEGLRRQNAVTEEEVQTLISAERVAEARFASALNGVNSSIAQIAVRAAEVDLIAQRIRDAHITAPFAGSIQQRFVAPGTFVQIGSPLVNVVRLQSLRFRGTAPERQATALQVGQSLRLSIETINQPIEAKVTRINPSLDMSSRSLTFEALIDNSAGQLRAGLFAEAEVVINPSAKAVVVNESALVEFAGAQKIWKVVDGMAQEQVVRPGRRSNRLVEILEGLNPGDKIIVNGASGRIAKVITEETDGKTNQTALTITPTPVQQSRLSNERAAASPISAEPATGNPGSTTADSKQESVDSPKVKIEADASAGSQNAG